MTMGIVVVALRALKTAAGWLVAYHVDLEAHGSAARSSSWRAVPSGSAATRWILPPTPQLRNRVPNTPAKPAA
jgi:hypothetical protein